MPPATIVSAQPTMIFSAAKAMDCSPDEQKRLMVTADAATGIPARRLAMRATFIPCSASGIAQPRMTSSTVSGSMPSARRNASRIATAASSSGRVVRNVPLGALPAGVRTADAMTASLMVLTRWDWTCRSRGDPLTVGSRGV